MTYKVVVAQLVSASGCGPEGRRFEPGLPPHFFARIPGKKITKPQGFTPMRDYLSSFICEKIVKKLIISER